MQRRRRKPHKPALRSRFIANRNPRCMEVHKANCVWVKKMANRNKVRYRSLAKALNDGFDGFYYCLHSYHSR